MFHLTPYKIPVKISFKEYYYELHANGARIRRGDDKVYFYPRP